ncbi:MAG: hypothetical protein EPN93_15500 [Spirochaetes bacterium]|nr:MAG: hypothetical protein EPN93_15500 [Spirochaetota bacterium]
MKLYSSEFTSVRITIEREERAVRPGGALKPKTGLDLDNSMQHRIELGWKDFLGARECIGRFFFTLATAGFGLVLLLGALSIGQIVSLSRSPFMAPEWMFIGGGLVVFFSTWVVQTVRAVIQHAKINLVTRERGNGNWKLLGMEEFAKTKSVLAAVRERELAEREKARIESEQRDRARFTGKP